LAYPRIFQRSLFGSLLPLFFFQLVPGVLFLLIDCRVFPSDFPICALVLLFFPRPRFRVSERLRPDWELPSFFASTPSPPFKRVPLLPFLPIELCRRFFFCEPAHLGFFFEFSLVGAFFSWNILPFFLFFGLGLEAAFFLYQKTPALFFGRAEFPFPLRFTLPFFLMRVPGTCGESSSPPPRE